MLRLVSFRPTSERRRHWCAIPRSMQARHGIRFEHRNFRRVHSVHEYDWRCRFTWVGEGLVSPVGSISEDISLSELVKERYVGDQGLQLRPRSAHSAAGTFEITRYQYLGQLYSFRKLSTLSRILFVYPTEMKTCRQCSSRSSLPN